MSKHISETCLFGEKWFVLVLGICQSSFHSHLLWVYHCLYPYMIICLHERHENHSKFTVNLDHTQSKFNSGLMGVIIPDKILRTYSVSLNFLYFIVRYPEKNILTSYSSIYSTPVTYKHLFKFIFSISFHIVIRGR